MTSSISRQLVIWLAVPLMLLALCGALVHYFNNVAPGVIASDRRLRDATNALMAHVRAPNGQLMLDTTANEAPPLPSPDVILYALRDTQGRLIAGSAALPVAVLNDATSQLIAMGEIGGRTMRTLTTRFDTQWGTTLLVVADERFTMEPAARYGLMSTLLWDFVQLDVTLVLVWVGIQLGLRPIKRLREEIAGRSPQDLRPIDESSVPREISSVVVNINRLFSLLRSSVQSQQQFISNAAHQLRTPITGMQAQLDLLVAERAAEPVKHRLLTLQEGIRQLAHSANQLLALARADPVMNISARKQPIDLSVMVAEVAAKFFDRALQVNIDLGIDVVPIEVRADSSLLDDLLSNLVDNALKYTPSGGSVTIIAGRNARAYISVEDTGVGIPETERQRVRQRFYRMPDSPGHGSGLGLAIVEEIARIHDASVEIGSGSNGVGTKVTVQFP